MHRTDEFLEAFLQSDPDPMINGEIPTADGRVQLLDPSCVTTLYGENYGKAFVIDEDCLSAHIKASVGGLSVAPVASGGHGSCSAAPVS